MRNTVAFFLFAASSVLAISIVTPTNWTPAGPNSVTFTSVDTDPSSFAAILVNQNGALLASALTLESFHYTSVNFFTFTASPALKAGSGYQVNFIKDVNSPHTILFHLLEIQGSWPSSRKQFSIGTVPTTTPTPASTPTRSAIVPVSTSCPAGQCGSLLFPIEGSSIDNANGLGVLNFTYSIINGGKVLQYRTVGVTVTLISVQGNT
ncbi:hypothetical protein P7C70_g6279, partial [Phenoliferia sp. Uapishka_3]